MSYEVYTGDCVDIMSLFMAGNSVDAIVTDPPYGLGFMGKKWDIGVPAVDVFKECLRVLKPGGHLLAFGGSRTYHRLAVAVEDAGFEIRDQIMWVYGSGFPKSRNVGNDVEGWDGWGTALKPAHEPILVARKPLSGTVAANVVEHGTGALNIDGCRVGSDIVSTHSRGSNGAFPKRPGEKTATESGRRKDQRDGLDHSERIGRWPANLIHDGSEEVLALFPESKGQQGDVKGTEPSGVTDEIYGKFNGRVPSAKRNDKGSAARFFYCAKASPKDRHEGLENPSPQFKHGATLRKVENTNIKGNNHPTVKPTELMQYLCRLVTPPGGTVFDPFMGSGSTGKAAILGGFKFIGVEMDEGYVQIAERRLSHATDTTKG